MHILKSNNIDDGWLQQIETNIAQHAYEVIRYRKEAIDKINANLSLISLPFNSCIVELIYDNSLKIFVNQD